MCWIAEREGIAAETLEVKSGILQSMESRAAFLHDPTHQVMLYYTPKHASRMNQVEIWLSVLVRKLLERSYFTLLGNLREQILAFIGILQSDQGYAYQVDVHWIRLIMGAFPLQ